MENTNLNDIKKTIMVLKILDYSEEDIKILLKKKGIDINSIKNIIKYIDTI